MRQLHFFVPALNIPDRPGSRNGRRMDEGGTRRKAGGSSPADRDTLTALPPPSLPFPSYRARQIAPLNLWSVRAARRPPLLLLFFTQDKRRGAPADPLGAHVQVRGQHARRRGARQAAHPLPRGIPRPRLRHRRPRHGAPQQVLRRFASAVQCACIFLMGREEWSWLLYRSLSPCTARTRA